jgi:hypothetical protein
MIPGVMTNASHQCRITQDTVVEPVRTKIGRHGIDLVRIGHERESQPYLGRRSREGSDTVGKSCGTVHVPSRQDNHYGPLFDT